MKVKAVGCFSYTRAPHVMMIRRYGKRLEHSPPADLYKSTARAFVVSSFVELPEQGIGAARGNVGPWCDHVKNMEWTRLDVLVPVALEGRRQSDATEHDLTKPD